MSKPDYQALLKSQYNVSVSSVTPFKSNVALVELDHGQQAIFKRARVDKGVSFIDKFRFRNEIRMYKAFQKFKFTFLHVPKMYSSGKDHILIEFIEREEGRNVTEGDFAKAYYEMQNLKISPSLKFDLFSQLTRGVWYRGLIVPILTLRKYIGINKALKAALLFLKLHLQTSSLKKRYWLHGDLAVRNVYYQNQSNKVFFIDFENMYYTRKWPLLEIFQRCVWYEGDEKLSFCFDFKSLHKYLSEAQKNKNEELIKSHLQNQFRISTLIDTSSRIIRPKTKAKTKAYNTLLNVILDDACYKTLFKIHLEPLIKYPDFTSAFISINELEEILTDKTSN